MTKVSVIVAVYNAESSLSMMIDSLLAQTMKDFEIIIVDDGSTDGSTRLCDEYAAKDSRVRVIHKVNEGVSAARQTGFDVAKGEYVIHADADDYVEPDMLKMLYDKAREEDVDVVFCNYYNDNYDGTISINRQKPPKKPTDVLYALLTRLHGSCWNKLARRSSLIKHNVRFPEGLNYCEDLLTWVQLFQYSDIKVSYVNKAFYHYISNPKSATRGGNKKMLENIRLFTHKMAAALPHGDERIDKYIKTLPIAPFQYAFQNSLVTDAESRAEYKRLRRVIWEDSKSWRWRLGYVCIELNLMSVARKLIKLYQ